MQELIALAQQGADFNISDENGVIPLMKAAKKGDPSLVKFMIKHTTCINQEDHYKHTALYYATENNKLEAVKLLCKNGAKITDDIFMLAVHKNFREIVNYFEQVGK